MSAPPASPSTKLADPTFSRGRSHGRSSAFPSPPARKTMPSGRTAPLPDSTASTLRALGEEAVEQFRILDGNGSRRHLRGPFEEVGRPGVRRSEAGGRQRSDERRYRPCLRRLGGPVGAQIDEGAVTRFPSGCAHRMVEEHDLSLRPLAERLYLRERPDLDD